MKVANPDYVVGKKPPYAMQPPVTHPPFCVCAVCPAHRQRKAEETGRTMDEVWSEPLVIRARRASPDPSNYRATAAAVQDLLVNEPLRLAAAVKAAEEAKLAKQNARCFGDIVDAYRLYMQSEGKRYDKAVSRINYIERAIGRDRDANSIDLADFRKVLASVAHLSAQSRRHYGSTFLAMMNNAKSEGVIRSHALADVRLPTVPKKTTRPVTWTEEELSVIIGPALDQYEIGQAKWNSKVGKVAGTGSFRTASKLPLRGMILIAYFTLMRPINNWALTWEEVTLDPVKGTGNFELDQHKNVNKGIRAYGRLARPLVDYLLTIRPRNARGYIHPNPETGKPYTDIRKQWDRLIAIASDMLGYPLVNEKADFFTFRHTGATNIAQMASNREELMRVVNMMGDTNVETVRRHYFNFTYDEDDQIIDRWELPKKLPPAVAQLVQPGSDLTN